ncbi:hypothetical protein HAX54_048440 [Datura stramonium]|uniref:Uncharacterized protein n=1 Tax=Datura stramonium TaxID=4076 RepID=A0ABS8RHU9_DATST|nr:hypothetical protein [Datura stramonium]
MNSLLSKQQYAYSKMEIEDPEEMQHRKAQFLIYKALKKSDSVRKQPWLKVRVFKLKIKIGRRLKRFRKSILLAFSVSKGGLHKQFMSQLKSWKGLLKGRESMEADKDGLHPLQKATILPARRPPASPLLGFPLFLSQIRFDWSTLENCVVVCDVMIWG